MAQSRREFLICCSTAAVTAGVPGTLLSALAGQENPLQKKGELALDQLSLKSFEPLVHSSFELSGEGGVQLTLELAKVTGRFDNPALEQFSLLFHGPSQPLLPQQIYLLKHAELGAFSLFLVPVGLDEQGARYEAIINRFVDKSQALNAPTK